MTQATGVKTIHKIQLPANPGGCLIELPLGMTPRRVDTQHNRPVLWFETKPASPIKQYKLLVLMTGEDVATETLDELQYLGTALLDGGAYVVHYYLERI